MNQITEGALRQIALDHIVASKTNTRSAFDTPEDRELAADIKARGVLQPILVRPKPDGGAAFELIAGERRWRASKAAGLTEIPAIVRVMSDAEAVCVQVIENLQRKGLDPIEEAKGFQTLIDAGEHKPEDLPAIVNKSRTVVFERLRLLKLPAKAQEAVIRGELAPSTGGLLVPILSNQQGEALKKVLHGNWQDEGPMSYRAAREMIEREYLRKLKGASFDSKKVCKECPHRSGNRTDCDTSSPDLCTNPTCFEKHTAAALEARAKTLEEQGVKVLGNEEGNRLSYAYVSLDDTCWDDPKGRAWRTVLKDVDVPRVAKRQGDQLVEYVNRTAATNAAVAAGAIKKSAGSSGYGQEEKRRAAKHKLMQGVVETAMFHLACKVTGGLPKGFWPWLGRMLVMEVLNFDAWRVLCRTRNLGTARDPQEAKRTLEKWLGQMQIDSDWQGAAVLALAAYSDLNYQNDFTEPFKGLCKLFGVNLQALLEEAKAAKAEKKKAATAGKNGKAHAKDAKGTKDLGNGKVSARAERMSKLVMVPKPPQSDAVDAALGNRLISLPVTGSSFQAELERCNVATLNYVLDLCPESDRSNRAIRHRVKARISNLYEKGIKNLMADNEAHVSFGRLDLTPDEEAGELAGVHGGAFTHVPGKPK